jgi:hypothetical protein
MPALRSRSAKAFALHISARLKLSARRSAKAFALRVLARLRPSPHATSADKKAFALRGVPFGRALQAAQRVGWSGDEAPSEDFQDQLSPPAWREDEVSVQCHAARVRVYRRDLNLFVVRDSKWQADIDRELARRTHVKHIERDAQPAESKDEMIARAH